MLLIDQRYTKTQYRSMFLAEWQPVYVDGKKTLERVLQNFWQTG